MSPELLAHYRSGSTTLARLWKITRLDEEVFCFTDHDRPITYLSLRYEPSSVFDASANATRSELNVDTMEARGLLDSDGITAAALEDGSWDGAEVEIVEVNYRDLTMGHRALRRGALGQIQRAGQVYTAELRGLMHKLQNTIGRTVKPACDAVLGDSRCGVDLEALRVSGTVTVATSARLFTTDLGGGDTYSYGVLTWISGANSGRSIEVKAHTATGVLELQLAMPYAVQVGDDFTITPGCDKRKETCINTFDNVLNFRGFSYVPGQDKVLLIGGQQ